MSLFEDLVEELKEDNLLEETIIDSVHKNEPKNVSKTESSSLLNGKNNSDLSVKEVVAKVENPQTEQKTVAETEEVLTIDSENLVFETENVNSHDFEDDDELIFETEMDEELPKQENTKPIKAEAKEEKKEPVDEKDFYRRRALDEVNGLEMVEHVLSGVEREYMKTVPKSYDDYEVKQALHEFLQVVDDVKSPKHAQAEFRLMQETEDWYSTLSRRDRNISVGHLRRYCETTKPSLSSQALISLARFYRNSPYSEAVRSKFDLVVTKLFTKDIGEKREFVFNAEELVQHIQELYAEWSSVPLYSTDENDSELLIAALSFQDFVNEAEKADTFDDLVKTDFFKRLKVFKEKTNENFFSPILVAAAIECNVAVGNRYVELLQQERNTTEVEVLSNKYGMTHDQSISEATSKTLQLLKILREKDAVKGEDQIVEEEDLKEQNNENNKRSIRKSDNSDKKGLFGANKWLVTATIITIIVAAVFFITSGRTKITSGNGQISKDVKVVNLDNSSLKQYVNSAKISEDTLFAITNDEWSKMSYGDKEQVIKKFLQTGTEKGFKSVHFLNTKGDSVAFASDGSINIVD